MTYIVQRKSRFYVVAYDGTDPLTGREHRRWHPAGHSRTDAEAIAVLRSAIHDLAKVRPARRCATCGRDWEWRVNTSTARLMCHRSPARPVEMSSAVGIASCRRTASRKRVTSVLAVTDPVQPIVPRPAIGRVAPMPGPGTGRRSRRSGLHPDGWTVTALVSSD